MGEEINFGIGFITGRPNSCRIINSYYKNIIEQVKKYKTKVNFTFFILYDLGYQNTKKEDFYNILPEVYENINIQYIDPEDVDKQKEKIIEKYNLTDNEASLFIGKGYAKARNSILYSALEHNIDYLLFWDDDEYPLANVKDGKDINWIVQNNVLVHLKNIEDADITYGYRCGTMAPLPYIQYNDVLTEEVYKDFVEALENEAISWEKVKSIRKNDTGLAYADLDIATGTKNVEYINNVGVDNFVLGSGICLNLRHIDKIPAFYNPPGARGEDTFFSCALAKTQAKVLRVPTYHFHDGFLKFTNLMDGNYPKRLRRIAVEDKGIEQRFLKTTRGWIKYKPLLCYISNRNTYREVIDEAKIKLTKSIDKIGTAFDFCDFSCLINELDEYDNLVEKHYDEYIETNAVWNKIKNKIMSNV